MHRRTLLLALTVAVALSLSLGTSLLPASGKTYTKANRFAPSGIISVDQASSRGAAARSGATATAPKAAAIHPSATGTSGCRDSQGGNVRVNQECTNQAAAALIGRAQSQNEPAAAVNPRNPNNVLASQNDYRRGDGACGADFSLDGGGHWGSELVPIGFTAPGFTGARHYWDASGDTSVAFDASGEAYLLCQAFNRGAPTSDVNVAASGIFLFRSADGGASWSFPGSPVVQSDGTGADGIGLLDKPYMTVDAQSRSPWRDRVYAAWIPYNTAFTAAPVAFAWSADHGASWHQSGTIGGTSAVLCPVNLSGAPAGTCDINQFPQPFVAPNGDVYVVFQNFNNALTGPADNHNQMLIVKSTDGGSTFGAPVKVTDFYDLPDCLTYTGHDAGRACVPTAPLSDRSIFRATDYPVGVAATSKTVAVTFGSYLNRHSNPRLGNCVPAGLSATTFLNLYRGVGVVDGCNNDIVLSVSTNGGASFTGTATPPWNLPSVSDENPKAQLADQWWQWAALTPRGGLAVSYYDRKYGKDQRNGFMDFTLRRGNGAHVRVTNRSVPPTNEFAEPGASTGVFLGDYTGLAVGSDGMAHPVWTDTRNPVYATAPGPDPRVLVQAGFGGDIYTRRLPA